MKTYSYLIFLLIVLIAATCFPPSAFAGNVCKAVDIDFMRRHLNIPQHTSIASKVPVNGLCQVILNIRGRYFTAYTSDDNFVILGKMYSNQAILDNTELSSLQKATFAKVRPELDKCVAINHKPRGNVENVVYMVTDPLCPYCNTATGKIKKFADNHNIEVKIAFFSVHGTAGDKKAVEAACRNFTLSEYMQDDWKKGNGEKYQCERGKALIKKSRPLARDLHIQGVPTFFLSDGTQVVGANMARFEKALRK